jgi:hypothetical protein
MDELQNILHDTLDPNFGGQSFSNIRGLVLERDGKYSEKIRVILLFKSKAEIEGGGQVVNIGKECQFNIYNGDLETIREIRNLEQEKKAKLDGLKPLYEKQLFRRQGVLRYEYETIRVPIKTPDGTIYSYNITFAYPIYPPIRPPMEAWFDPASGMIDITGTQETNEHKKNHMDEFGQDSLYEDQEVQNYLYFFEQDSLNTLDQETQWAYEEAYQNEDIRQALLIALKAESRQIEEFYNAQIDGRKKKLGQLKQRAGDGTRCIVQEDGVQYDISLIEAKHNVLTITIYDEDQTTRIDI